MNALTTLDEFQAIVGHSSEFSLGDAAGQAHRTVITHAEGIYR